MVAIITAAIYFLLMLSGSLEKSENLKVIFANSGKLCFFCKSISIAGSTTLIASQSNKIPSPPAIPSSFIPCNGMENRQKSIEELIKALTVKGCPMPSIVLSSASLTLNPFCISSVYLESKCVAFRPPSPGIIKPSIIVRIFILPNKIETPANVHKVAIARHRAVIKDITGILKQKKTNMTNNTIAEINARVLISESKVLLFAIKS